MMGFAHSTTRWVVPLAIALAVAAAGCGTDDDESGAPDGNGWTQGGGGCGAWSWDGSSAQGAWVVPADVEDCIPARLPDEAYRESLRTILSAYLGNYVDDDGNPKVLSCRPEGHWELPAEVPDNAACTTAWSIPIWVTLESGSDPYESDIWQESGSGPEFPVNMDRPAAFEFVDGEGNYFQVGKDRDADIMRWDVYLLPDPDHEPVEHWTKVD